MFDIGWVEMTVIAVLMIIVIGPKDLPKVLHTLGKWVGQARAMARSFQENLDDMVRESGLDDVRKEIESVSDYDIGGEITKAIDSDGKIAGALDMGEDGKDAEDAEDAEATENTAQGVAPASAPGETSGDGASGVAESPVEPVIEPVAEPAKETPAKETPAKETKEPER